MTGDDIRRAINEACSLTNPRLSEVDWDDVAAALRRQLFKGNHAVFVSPDGMVLDPLADGRKADDRPDAKGEWCETCGVRVGHLFPHD